MFKTKKKEIIICLIAIVALIFTMKTNVFADTVTDLNNTGNTNANVTNYSNLRNNTTLNKNTNTNTNIKTNTNTNNANATGLPKTGLDSTVVFIIAICGLSAVYAYKKIRDYNI